MERSNGKPARYVYPHDPHTEMGGSWPFPIRSASRSPSLALVVTRALPVNHAIVPHWDEISDKIMEQLRKVNIRWVTIGCFGRRQMIGSMYDEDRAVATVLITVPTVPVITDEIKDALCEIHKLSGNLFVELIEGSIRRSASKSSNMGTETRDQPTPYKVQPRMGASIGVSNLNRFSGTLGGYLELFKEGEPTKVCGLTCHHVVQPSATKIPPDEHYAPISDAGGKSIRICHPSIGDHKRTISDDKKKLRDLQLYIKSKNKISPAKTEVEKLRDTARQIEQKIALVTSADKDVGTVFASSGYKICKTENRQIDWALIDMDRECIGSNLHPLLEDSTITGFWPSGISITDRLYHFGRISESMDGVFNGVKTCTLLEGTPKAHVTKELTVVHSSSSNEKWFSGTGDSGALVIGCTNKAVVGMIWGGQEKLGLTYFTPIETVAKDIHEQTGYNVRLPGGEQIA